jgi:hypothetical protein
MTDPKAPPRSDNQSMPLDPKRGWHKLPAGSNPPGYVYDLTGPTGATGAPSPKPPSPPYTGWQKPK